MKIIGIDGKRNICGEKLRKFRMEKGLSQESLAAKIQLRGLDLTQKTISRIETGKRLITDYELKYLADALGVPVRELLDGGEKRDKREIKP